MSKAKEIITRQGEPGPDAYQLALQTGTIPSNTTLAQWLANLKGDPGNDGANGSDGAVGPKGDPGNDGANGNDGATGPAGPKGDPGNDGSPDTPEQVRDKYESNVDRNAYTDAEKAKVSSTEAALATKYDASNPAEYQTAAEVASSINDANPTWIADGNPIVTATHVFTTGTVDGEWTIHRHDRVAGIKTIANETNNSGITTLADAKSQIETLNYTAL